MAWTPEQQQAIQTTGKDLCITASAGSGKTTVLVERVLHLVRERRVPLERIVAITFTEKAAAEMKDRLRGECRQRENGGAPEEMNHWRDLARQVETARMSTIHAFCAGLLRQNALAYRIDPPLDPDFTVVDEAESHLLRAEVVESAVEELLEEPHAQTLRLAGHYGVFRLKEMLGHFLSSPVLVDRMLTDDRFTSPEKLRACWAALVERVSREQLLALRHSASLKDYQRKLEEFAGRCTRESDGREQQRLGALSLIRRIMVIRDPEAIETGISAFLATRLGSTRKTNWCDEATFEELKDTQENFKKFLKGYECPPYDPEIEQRSAELTCDSVACFRAVYERYRAAKSQRNTLDFNDLVLMTLRMLRTQTDIRERVARGIEHLLIDEFQDTDSEQHAIAQLLSQTESKPELFIVGDAKQSIYRFRGAEVEVFNSAKEGCETIGLHQNFRTVPEIVKFVNTLFSRTGLLGAVEPEYVPATAFRPSAEECRVHFLIPEAAQGKENVSERRAREANMIGDWIATACSGQSDVRIQSKGGNAMRPVTFGDFALLFRALSDVSIYERALSERHIPFHVISGKGFYERQEVLDIRNLLQAVVDPWHEPAVLGFLRSPMVGLDDDSLLDLCRGPGATAALLESVTPEDFPQCDELDHARAILRDLRAQRTRPLPDFVRYVFERTGYEAILAGLFLGDQRACNVRKVAQLAEAFAATRRPRLSAFVRYLDDVASSEFQEGEAALQAEGSDEVTIMSIHKSKGLEFPVVILPDLSRKAHASRTSRILFNREFGPLARIYEPAKKDAPEPQLYELMKRDEASKEEAERARLLYVAMTRARDWLVLSGSLESGTKAGVPADSLLAPFANEFRIDAKNDGDRFAEDGWTAHVQCATTSASLPKPDYEKPQGPDVAVLGRRLEAAPAIPAAQRSFAVTTLVHRMYPSDEARPGDGTAYDQALDPLMRGTLVHRYFELWHFNTAPPDVDAFLTREMPSRHLHARLHEALRKAADDFVKSDAFNLVRDARDIRREQHFALRIGDAILEGQIDAILDGITVLDYKTGLHTPSRYAMYQAQLCLYAEAMNRLGAMAPQTAYLYYVDTGELEKADISKANIEKTLECAAKTIQGQRNEPVPNEMEAYLQ